MCGRIAQTTTIERMESLIHIVERLDMVPRYNIAPTMTIYTIRLGEDNQAHWIPMRWGLIPRWAKEMNLPYSTFNAKSETVEDKPSFRDAFKKRHCVIPVDGFYEWHREGGQKQPYYFKRSDTQPMLLAGLWERWEGQDGEIESCTVLTTEANRVMAPVHHRMPVIIDLETFEAWMHPGREQDFGKALLAPYQGGKLEKYRVDKRVNNARYDAPDCLEPDES